MQGGKNRFRGQNGKNESLGKLTKLKCESWNGSNCSSINEKGCFEKRGNPFTFTNTKRHNVIFLDAIRFIAGIDSTRTRTVRTSAAGWVA